MQRKGNRVYNPERIIKYMMRQNKVSITKMAKDRGVERSTIYRNLKSDITLEVFNALAESCGYRLLAGKWDGEHFSDVKALRWYTKEERDKE